MRGRGCSEINVEFPQDSLPVNEKGQETGKTTKEIHTETLAVMAWFGYAPTNEPVAIGPGQTAPGFELVDNEQRLIGIQNPEGWRNNFVTGAKKVTWSDTKQLYR